MLGKLRITSRARRRRLAAETEGSATVEACLWLPLFVAFFLLILDTSWIFMTDNRIQRIAQDGTRQYIKGAFGTDRAALETWIESRIRVYVPTGDATATFDSSTNLLTTVVTYPASEADMVGTGALLRNVTMRTRIINQAEF